jgi:hypothetical protein
MAMLAKRESTDQSQSHRLAEEGVIDAMGLGPKSWKPVLG